MHYSDHSVYDGVIENEKHCKLCKKLLLLTSLPNKILFNLYSDCYLISTDYMESTLTKKQIMEIAI